MAYDRKILYKNSKPPIWAYVLAVLFFLLFLLGLFTGRAFTMIINGVACAGCTAAAIGWHKSGKGDQKVYKEKLKEITEDALLEQINDHCLLSKVKDDTAFFITDEYTFLAGSFIVKTEDVAWFYVVPQGAANSICIADKKGNYYSGKTAVLSLKAELEPKVRGVLPHIFIGYSQDTEKQYNKKYCR